jgi:outer membrane protein assembly factor BamA
MGTENGTWGAFAGHLHNWNDGRIRYLVAGGFASLNLDWFGQGTTSSGQSFPYTLESAFLIQKLTFKLGDSDFFLGPTQRILSTSTSFESGTLPPGIESDWLSTSVSGLGFNVGYDTRNSMFGPTRGTKTSLDVTQNDKAIGSDFDYTRAGLESCNYLPLGGPFTLGLRGDLQYAGEDAPYFDLPGISLRGIRYGRYVDNVSLTLESELRWDTTPRWTLVGFGGVGWVADKFDELDESKGRGAGGFGVRYLIAKEYDLRVGLDVAAGPEDEAIYVTLGTGWVRD